MLLGIDQYVLHRRNVADAGDLVVGERGVGHLAAVEPHVFGQGKAELHDRAPLSCVRATPGLIGLPQSAALTSFVTRTAPVSVSTSTSTPAPPIIQNGVTLSDSPVCASGDFIGRHETRRADDVAGLHAVALLKISAGG